MEQSLDPTTLILRKSICFYCNNPSINDAPVAYMFGIRYCIDHADSATRDCIGWHHAREIDIVNVRIIKTASMIIYFSIKNNVLSKTKKDELFEYTLYKASHFNHPSAIWVRKSEENYRWLYRMWFYLLQEYTYRYGKKHACEKLMSALYLDPINIPIGEFTEPTPAMPDIYKVTNDSIRSYQNYYIHDKARFANWKNREIPEWFSYGVNNANIQLHQ
mgnify:CR=1 FL=1